RLRNAVTRRRQLADLGEAYACRRSRREYAKATSTSPAPGARGSSEPWHPPAATVEYRPPLRARTVGTHRLLSSAGAHAVDGRDDLRRVELVMLAEAAAAQAQRRVGHQVAHRDEADHVAVVVHHRQVAEVAGHPERHTLRHVGGGGPSPISAIASASSVVGAATSTWRVIRSSTATSRSIPSLKQRSRSRSV